MGRAVPDRGRPLRLGRLSLRGSDGVMISRCKTLFSLFPTLRFGKPEEFLLVTDGTLGRIAGGWPN